MGGFLERKGEGREQEKSSSEVIYYYEDYREPGSLLPAEYRLRANRSRGLCNLRPVWADGSLPRGTFSIGEKASDRIG